jgi:hypothetical protein
LTHRALINGSYLLAKDVGGVEFGSLAIPPGILSANPDNQETPVMLKEISELDE